MKTSSQLSDVLHVLLHIAEADGPATSEALSEAMQTNPVVLRRLLAGLRDMGLVASAKGHGGGWILARALEHITLLDVYTAIGAPRLVALGFRADEPACLVAQAVNGRLKASIEKAEAVLIEDLAAVTLEAIWRDFHVRLAHHKKTGRRAKHLLQHHAVGT
jgi:Rrf2 family protein